MEAVSFIDYTCIRGDTYDALALKYYGNESMSTYIMDANPYYNNMVIFEGGETLKIPVLFDTELPESLPPWRR